jgi:hypothetical protein
MTTFARRMILLALGTAGGLAVWPVAEEMLSLQKVFGSYLAFLAVLGALVGLIMGAVFGAAEGSPPGSGSAFPRECFPGQGSGWSGARRGSWPARPRSG